MELTMKLDRNINPGGLGKYALLKLRTPNFMYGAVVLDGKPNGPTGVVVNGDAIDYGDTPDTDFFVIRLKDKYAHAALLAYATAAKKDGELECAEEVHGLAMKSLNRQRVFKPT